MGNKTEGRPAGNNSVMREALLKASDALTEAAHHNLTEEYINECLALIRDALVKPARNCDVFESEAKRQAAFIAYYNKASAIKGTLYEIGVSDLKYNMDSILIDYIEWLFEPEKPETKGDNDGR